MKKKKKTYFWILFHGNRGLVTRPGQDPIMYCLIRSAEFHWCNLQAYCWESLKWVLLFTWLFYSKRNGFFYHQLSKWLTWPVKLMCILLLNIQYMKAFMLFNYVVMKHTTVAFHLIYTMRLTYRLNEMSGLARLCACKYLYKELFLKKWSSLSEKQGCRYRQ